MTLDNHCRLYGTVSSRRQAASSQDVVAVRGVSSWRPGTSRVHHPHTPPALAVVEAPSIQLWAGGQHSCLELDPGLATLECMYLSTQPLSSFRPTAAHHSSTLLRRRPVLWHVRFDQTAADKRRLDLINRGLRSGRRWPGWLGFRDTPSLRLLDLAILHLSMVVVFEATAHVIASEHSSASSSRSALIALQGRVQRDACSHGGSRLRSSNVKQKWMTALTGD